MNVSRVSYSIYRFLGGKAANLFTNLVASTISDEIARKTQNVTDCVPVPTSEHVAEIVGRQGLAFVLGLDEPHETAKKTSVFLTRL